MYAFKGMKSVAYNKTIYVYGTNGANTIAYSSSSSDGATWNQLSRIRISPSDAYKSIVVNNNLFYIISDGTVLNQQVGPTGTRYLQAQD